MNSFGNIFRLTSFGESHGVAIGGVIDGVPAGVTLDLNELQTCLSHRRPGSSPTDSQRHEPDTVEFISGILDGVTLGTPIGFLIRNTDQRSADYDDLREIYRPSHADFTYQMKYGIRDWRGGGRASARETAARVVAGAIASQILKSHGIKVHAYTSQIGNIGLPADYRTTDYSTIYSDPARCPDSETAAKMLDLLNKVKADGDSVGGAVTCVIMGCPAGLGEPIFGKLQAMMAQAMMSIPAAKAFEYGMGFAGCTKRGSEMADPFVYSNGFIHTSANHSGGIQGGITNGEEIRFRVGFKPIATIMQPQATTDIHGQAVTFTPRGRHDVCAVPRAVAVVEAMAAMVILDAWLLNKTCR